jgi:Spore coat polysaccharide biosynthesis protein F, CMP-KDO synthetase homolog
MTVAAIVQARLGSSRLPGKVLAEVAGKPLLEYLLERLERAESLHSVVVATSDDPSDDAIAAFCAVHDVDCHRGPLDDVAQRTLDAVDKRGLDAFVRISADSPLLDPKLVDRAVALLGADEADLATNIFPRTFPHGQSVEAFDSDAFRRGAAAMVDAHDREHVTPYFYRHADEFRISSFTQEPDLSSLQLAVDTPDDLGTFASLVGAMSRPHWDYTLEELVQLARTLNHR